MDNASLMESDGTKGKRREKRRRKRRKMRVVGHGVRTLQDIILRCAMKDHKERAG